MRYARFKHLNEVSYSDNVSYMFYGIRLHPQIRRRTDVSAFPKRRLLYTVRKQLKLFNSVNRTFYTVGLPRSARGSVLISRSDVLVWDSWALGCHILLNAVNVNYLKWPHHLVGLCSFSPQAQTSRSWNGNGKTPSGRTVHLTHLILICQGFGSSVVYVAVYGISAGRDWNVCRVVAISRRIILVSFAIYMASPKCHVLLF